MKKLKNIFLIITCIALGWIAFQYYSISMVGEYSKPEAADVIIVLGAAVWPTGPSPALQARIYHAEVTYREGWAQYFILTGGMGKYPPTEAQAMKEKLLFLGIEEKLMFLEEQATNTRENIRFSKEIMDKQKWDTAIIVTDSFHLKRALVIAKEMGITAYGTPAKNSSLYRNKALKFRYTMREILALSQHYLNKFLKT